jgi:hypothetical protein
MIEPRNQLGSLSPEHEARCASAGIVFAVLHHVAGQDTPFLVTALRPLAAIAADALPAADALLVRNGVVQAVKLLPSAALTHTLAPFPE